MNTRRSEDEYTLAGGGFCDKNITALLGKSREL